MRLPRAAATVAALFLLAACAHRSANPATQLLSFDSPQAPPINTAAAPGPAPAGMRWIPGGEFWMGSSQPSFTDTRPWHLVYVDGFWMDTTAVTNDEFEAFVAATRYVTTAEKAPTASEYPGVPKSRLVAGSAVFIPPNHPVPLTDLYQWWKYVPGANWRHPNGPQSNLAGWGMHPVVQVTYDDAKGYCAWAGGRLPTEAEFEFASRGGLDRKTYVWGDEFKPHGKTMAHTFQGHFPDYNAAPVTTRTTVPVASYPPNGYGLYDMSGNVWEWVADWYRSDYYAGLADKVTVNPQGPPDSYDPTSPGAAERSQRGGSFLCTDQYCTRYVAGGRSKSTPDTSTNHVGFRCVRDAKPTATALRP